jgi:hypothetical protein
MIERPSQGGDWRWLLLLFLAALPVRLWLVGTAEVAARDSIGFIRYALEFEHKSWQAVLLGNHQHPGYPLAIWAVSQPVRALAGTDPITMRISAQLASTLAALALLIPMFYLGKELFNRQVGFWGALMFQYLPISGHHLADGISEALFMFLVAMALWRGVVAVRTYKPLEFAWCGLFGGLAYFTRPEGALVVMAAGFVLVGMQLVAGWRRPWRAFFAGGLSLGASAALIGSIYFLTVGHFTNKPAVWNIGKIVTQQADAEPPAEQVVARRPLMASIFGVFLQRSDYLPTRLGRALGGMSSELSQSFHYVGWVPALLALFWSWPRLRRDPGFWIPAGYCLLHAVILLLLAMVEFYVSDRHTMVLVMCGVFFTVEGVRDGSCRLMEWIQKRQPANAKRGWWSAERLAAAVLVVGFLICLPKSVQTLHGNRAGNRLAGLWLASQLKVGDVVTDDHAYSHYYAGLVFEEKETPVLPKGYQPTCYVVVTRSKDMEIDLGRTENEASQKGRLVYQWPENKSFAEARVVVYAQPRDWVKNPWTVEP